MTVRDNVCVHEMHMKGTQVALQLVSCATCVETCRSLNAVLAQLKKIAVWS